MSLAFLLTPFQKGAEFITQYAKDLKAQATISEVWNEYVQESNIIKRRFEDFELKAETRKGFENLHAEWVTDYEYLIRSTQHSGIYTQQFQSILQDGLGIVETGTLMQKNGGEKETDINQELQDAWQSACKVCRKQKSSVKCEGC